MNYSREEFYNLMDAAAAQGAEHLEAVCPTTTYEFAGLRRPVKFRGCGHAALFEVPYESNVADAPSGSVRVCAVEDAMGRWPRFGGDRYAQEDT